jgi:hypothetical protein
MPWSREEELLRTKARIVRELRERKNIEKTESAVASC